MIISRIEFNMILGEIDEYPELRAKIGSILRHPSYFECKKFVIVPIFDKDES